MQINICHLYPDLLNLYGDQGNVRVLKHRLEARGIDCQVHHISHGQEIDFTQCDILFIGGGQEAQQMIALEELHKGRGAQLKSAVEDGLVLLSIGGGFELLGKSYQTIAGQEIELSGLLDMHCIAGKTRQTGDYAFTWQQGEEKVQIVGFENHSTKTYLGSGLSPLGTIISGHGNNGEDKTEGACYKNLFGSYSHGPLLPKNPVLADHLLSLALLRKYGKAQLAPLDDRLEQKAQAYILDRLIAQS